MATPPDSPLFLAERVGPDARHDYTVHSDRGMFIGRVRATSSLDALRALCAHAGQPTDQPVPCEVAEVLHVDPDCLVFYVQLRPGAEPTYYKLKNFKIERVCP